MMGLLLSLIFSVDTIIIFTQQSKSTQGNRSLGKREGERETNHPTDNKIVAEKFV